MPWHAEHDPELNIIHVIYAGRLTAEDFKQGTRSVIDLANAFDTHLILIDDTRLEAAVSKLDIYEMPQTYDDMNGTRGSRMALILPPSGQIRKDVLFYETVCRNRGWFVKSFDDRQAALDWLLRKPGDNKPDVGSE